MTKKAINPYTGNHHLHLRIYRHIKILPYPTYFYNTYISIYQNKRTNSKADLFAHLFGQFVNCIQHIIIV